MHIWPVVVQSVVVSTRQPFASAAQTTDELPLQLDPGVSHVCTASQFVITFWLELLFVTVVMLLGVTFVVLLALLLSSLFPPHAASVAQSATTTRDAHCFVTIATS
jgi:hypothetical protein